jgi:spore maturation protein CgeB
MKILYIGESWLGSCARSLKEALARQPGIEIDEISEDAAFPKPQASWLRVLAKITHKAYQREFSAAIESKVRAFQPDAILVYKGWSIDSGLFDLIKPFAIPVINIYPDNSPHGHGSNHRIAVGRYDAVISTKAYHPSLWSSLYGYQNPCYFVPQGYDPHLSLRLQPAEQQRVDVVLAATFRPEYAELMRELSVNLPPEISLAIAGNGWQTVASQLPSNWQYIGPVHGRGYTDFIRSGQIVIAPMSTQPVDASLKQPGDVDTTRTYELAAAHCFFIHRHSDYVRQLYSEQEVPTFQNGKDLAEQIMRYLPQPELRLQMAAAAHRRAVPAYSLDSRAQAILAIISQQLEAHHAAHQVTTDQTQE